MIGTMVMEMVVSGYMPPSVYNPDMLNDLSEMKWILFLC